MNKPQKHTTQYYDYHECQEYLNSKYEYDERDVLGSFKENYGKNLEYRDFWHFVCDRYGPNNGSYFTFSKGDLSFWQENNMILGWQAEIYQRYLDHFADEKGEIYFYVWW